MRALSVVLAGILATEAVSQVPTVTLGKRTGTLPDGFSNVVGIQELGDERLVVSDAKDRLIHLADFRSGTVERLGRQGNGPNEYQTVSGLFRIAGDTIVMADVPSRRLLRIAPNGSLAGTQLFEIAATPLPEEKTVGRRLIGGARYVDRAGILYSSIEYLGENPGEGVLPNASFLVANDPVRKTFKRVAPLQPWYPEKSTRWRAPFMYGDAWAVGSDGRIARVVPTDYHVEWWKDGQLVSKGAPVPYTPVKVTKADRDAWYAARAARGPATGGITGPPPPPSSTPAPQPARPAFKEFADEDFPAFKPPFLEEYVGRGATISPEGELWVTRVVETGQPPLVDVFDAKGALVRRVQLPKDTRIGGFGKSALYLIRTDDDGLQWVDRYAKVP